MPDLPPPLPAGKSCPGFINTILDGIDLPVERVRLRAGTAQLSLEARTDMVIRENVLYQMQRIQRSKVLLEAMQKNALAVAGAYYDLDTGRVGGGAEAPGAA
jgi:carbonic anhydrase